MVKVLVACEFSGVVRDAFTARGHDATSCDLLPSETPGKHYQGPVEDILGEGWDLIIAHPPCTYLCVSGNAHYAKRPELYNPAADFAKSFERYAERVCVENPVGRLSTLWRKPDQYVQPWQFGHGECKKTGLWLKGLPPLVPTDIVSGRGQSIHRMSPNKDRRKERSRTFEGIAKAMASQWG